MYVTKDLFATEQKIADAMTKQYIAWQKQLHPLKWYATGKVAEE